jgi:hypothetical protein
MKPLDVRIVDAFGDTPSSDAVAALIMEVEAAASEASSSADQARTRALNPALSLDTVRAARAEMEDAAFIRDRMGAAAERLAGRLKEVRRAEEDRRRQTAYDEVKAERDKPPSLTGGVRLPAFKFDQFAPYAWPRPEQRPKPSSASRETERVPA